VRLVQLEDLRARPRTRLRRPLLALVVSAIAVMAVIQPSPAADGRELELIAAAPMPVVRAPGPMDSPTHAPKDRLLQVVDTARADPRPDRPAFDVPQPAAQSVARPIAGSTVAFLGDSYTSGWNGAGLGPRGWPGLIANARGWRTVNLAVAGTGFINPGWTNQPVGSRVSEVIKRQPDVVFIAAGHNDSRWSSTATAKAADQVIDRLHAALPDALLVIVAPIWPSASPPRRCVDLRDHLRRTAASVDAIFIDPLAEGWFSESRQRLIGSDGIHPTAAGHRYMAERVLAALAEAG
jgi:lysophospholipase L1-like esterase